MSEKQTSQKNSSSLIHTLLYTLLIGVLAVSGYLNYINFTKVEEKAPQPIAPLSFEELPQDVQNDYIPQARFLTLQKESEEMIHELNATQEQIERFEEEKLALETKLSDLISSQAQSQVEDLKLTKSKDFAKCYDMKSGSYSITKACRHNITAYIDKHKDAKYFEIIGIVDPAEFILFKNLEKNRFIYPNLKVTQCTINNLKSYAQTGLAKNRAVEASWVIKTHTQQKALTYTVHYELVSKKGYKGVVIRAYN